MEIRTQYKFGPSRTETRKKGPKYGTIVAAVLQ